LGHLGKLVPWRADQDHLILIKDVGDDSLAALWEANQAKVGTSMLDVFVNMIGAPILNLNIHVAVSLAEGAENFRQSVKADAISSTNAKGARNHLLQLMQAWGNLLILI